MPTVTLATHCHSRDLPRLHTPGVLEGLIESHQYQFDEILVIHQRCADMTYQYPFGIKNLNVIDIQEEDYPIILNKFGIPHKDQVLSELTHGWSWQWYYEHHCVNHCAEILAAKTDYIVFCDADCRIKNQPDSWIIKGIELLEAYNHTNGIFVVAPSDGGHEAYFTLDDGTRLTQTMSQQLFMGRVKQLKEMDFTNLQWDGKFDAPYGPMQEFYGMMEGWIWRYMRANRLHRAILPEQWRYWHNEWH